MSETFKNSKTKMEPEDQPVLLQQACDSCRLRKMKCSKEFPQCFKCKEHGWKCVYSPRRARTPLTRAYVTKVEKRLHSLERLLKRILPPDLEINDLLRKLQDNEPNLFEASQDRDDEISSSFFKQINLTAQDLVNVPVTVDNIRKISKSKAHTKEEAKVVDYQPEDYLINIKNMDLTRFDERNEAAKNSRTLYDSSVDGMAALSNDTGLNLDSSNSNGYFGINSSNGLLKFLHVKSESNGNSILELNALSSVENEDEIEENYSLDPEINQIWKNIDSGKIDDLLDNFQFQSMMVSSFFETYHKVYPFINRKNFFSRFRAFLDGSYASSIKLSDESNEEENHFLSFQVLLNTILAIGVWCKMGENSKIHSYYYNRVKILLMNINLFEYSDMLLLESFVLLSNYVQKTNKPNTGWSYLGLSTRIATSLGLHKEVKFQNNSNISGLASQDIALFESIENRKRLWWGMYFFDVGTTLTFGRPLTIPPLSTIDLENVSNVDDRLLSNAKTSSDVIVEYPTIYTTLIYESELTKVSTRVYNYNSTVLKRNNDESKMIGLLEMNDLLDEFVFNLPSYYNEDNQIASQNLINAWSNTGYNNDSVFVPKWFSVSRLRLICRYKNLKMLIFRYIMWDNSCKSNNSSYNKLKLRCEVICFNSSFETIDLINSFLNNNELDYLTAWYATYFLFQAALIPILSLLIDKDKQNYPIDSSTKENNYKYIEISKQNFNKLKRFNNLAGKFIKLVDLIVSGSKESITNELPWKGLLQVPEKAFSIDEVFDLNFFNS